MRILIIATKTTAVQQLTIASNELGDRAYEKIRRAMDDFREYGNDGGRTVEFELGDGPACFRIADIVSVTCEDPDLNKDTRIELALKVARWRKEIKERLQQEGLTDHLETAEEVDETPPQ